MREPWMVCPFTPLRPSTLTSRRYLKARQSPGCSEKPYRSDIRRSHSFMERARISQSYREGGMRIGASGKCVIQL